MLYERHAGHHVEWIEATDRRLSESGGGAIAEIEAALPELRAALGWLLDNDRIELAGRLVGALCDYGLLRLRPDVVAWSERVTAADPDDRSPLAPVAWAVSGYAAWMAGDMAEALDLLRTSVSRPFRQIRSPPGRVAMRFKAESPIGQSEGRQ